MPRMSLFDLHLLLPRARAWALSVRALLEVPRLRRVVAKGMVGILLVPMLTQSFAMAATVTVTVNPTTATLTVGSSKTFTATVSGTTRKAVTWSVVQAGGGTITTRGVYKAPSIPGTYTVRAKSTDVSKTIGSATVTVVAAPVTAITVPTVVTTGVPGFTASVPSQPGTSYAWTLTGGTITSIATSNLITYTPTAAAGALLSFSCKVTNAAGTASTGTATSQSIAAPIITSFAPAASTLTQGGSTSLTAAFTNGTGFVDNAVGAVTSGSGKTVTPAGTTQYKLTVTNAAGTSVPASTTVTVVAPPITTITGATMVTTGDVGVTASVPVQPGSTYQWSINGGIIPAGASSNAVTFTAGAVGTLSLTCQVTNAAGTLATSAPFNVMVLAIPVATITAPSSASPGQTGLSASVPVQSGCTYAWTVSGGTLTAGTGTNAITFTAGALGNLDLQCVVTNAAGKASAPGTATLVVSEPVTVSLSPSTVTLLAGQSQTFGATVTNGATGTVSWTVQEGATGGTVTQDGLYTAPSNGGTFHVIATSQDDSSKSTTATVTCLPLVSGAFKDAGGYVTETLWQNGTTVTGDWNNSGSARQFTGTLNGYVLSGTWTQGTTTGTFSISFSADGNSFSGSWAGFGSASWSGTRQAGVIVKLTPSAAKVAKPGDVLIYTAQVAGSADTQVIWSATAGTVVDGVYTVPSGVDDTVQTVTATAHADQTKKQTAQVSVAPTGFIDISGFFKDAGGYVTETLWQNGTTVTGDWNNSGSARQFTGTLNGYVLSGTWTQGTTTGTFSISFSADGNSFSGSWAGFGSASWSGTRQAGVIVKLTPSAAKVAKPGDVLTYSALVAGSPDKAVIWTATAGSVTNGIYTVPNGVDNTVQTVTATAQADAAVMRSALVSVTPTGFLEVSGFFKDAGGYVTETLWQNGTTVTGDWNNSGSARQFTGTLNGYVLSGTWTQGTTTGTFSISFSADGNSFSGSWAGFGSASWSGTRQAGVIVKLTPSAAKVAKPGDVLTYSALVAGSPDKAVIWTATAGSVTNGIYTVPNGVDDTVQTVTATAHADQTKKQTAQVSVAPTGFLDISGFFKDAGGYVTETLWQNGSSVSGDWVSYGSARQFTGTINGYVLSGTWTQGTTSGTFSISFSADGNSFSGNWDGAGSSSWSGTRQLGVYVKLTPAAAKIAKSGDVLTYTALVAGSPEKAVIWTATAGTVVDGVYTVPTGVDYTAQTVTVTAQADSTKTQSAQVSVTPTGVLFISGSYADSGNYQAVTFYQSGTRITGDYTKPGTQYTLVGTLNGYGLTGTLTPVSGGTPYSFSLTFSPSANSFSGNVLNLLGAQAWYWSGTKQTGVLSLKVTPGAVTLVPGQPQQFTAELAGSLDDRISWSTSGGASIGADGMFMAPAAPGTYTVTATAAAGPVKTATVTVRNGVGIQLSQTWAQARPGTPVSFSAQVWGTSNTSVIWDAFGGSISPDGTFIAPAEPGAYRILATSAADGSQTATAWVEVVPVDVPFIAGVYVSSFSGVFTFSQYGASVWGNWAGIGDFQGTLVGNVLQARFTNWAETGLMSFRFGTDGTFRGFAGHWGDSDSVSYGEIKGVKYAGVGGVYLPDPYLLATPGQILSLKALVGGDASKGVLWSASAGSIDSDGVFSVPTSVGIYTVTATSVANSAKSASFKIEVPGNVPVVAYSYDFKDLYLNTTEVLNLFQSGSHVTGTFASGRGGIDGWLTGSSFKGTWIRSTGQSYVLNLTFGADASSFTGSYVQGLNVSGTRRSATLLSKVTPSLTILRAGESLALHSIFPSVTGITLRWSASSGGEITQDGRYSAPTVPGMYSVTLTPEGGDAAPGQGTIWVVGQYPQVTGAFNSYMNASFPNPDKLGLTQAGETVQGTFFGSGSGVLNGTFLGWVLEGDWQNGNYGKMNLTFKPDGSRFWGTWGFYGSSNNQLSWSGSTYSLLPTLYLTPTQSTLYPGWSRSFLVNVPGTTDQRVTWSIAEPGGGTMTPGGVYNAPLTFGSYHVTATSVADTGKSATAIVEVVPPPPVTVDPDWAELLPGGKQAFHAFVQGLPSGAVTWSLLEPNGGSVDGAGNYTAPLTPGTYHVVATSTADTTKSASAIVEVATPAQVSVTITPGTVELTKGGTASFTALVDGGATQGVTWTCTSGSIDTAGNYTAPQTYGTYTVKATSIEDPSSYAVASVVVSSGTGSDRAFVYDLNGNLLDDGERTFEWDAENRLVAVTIKATGHRSEFGYDGLGRRVSITEKDLDATQILQVTSDKKYLWDGTDIAEERSPDGATVTKRFYAQGFIDNDGTALFYTRDHLGSIRELTDGQQNVRARYDYDPYGRMTKVSGDRDSVFQYAGYFYHAQSGLDLTLFRAYDPYLGRWIRKDPIGIFGGINLYGYCYNDPINQVDPLGLVGDSITNALKACLLMAPCARLDCLQAIFDSIEYNPFWKPFFDAMNKLKTELPNRLNHLFDSKHNFDSLLNQFGSNKEALYDAIYKATEAAYRAGGLPAGQTVYININGTLVSARGAIVNGNFVLTTAGVGKW